MEHTHNIVTSYRLISEYSNDYDHAPKRVELSSNLPTIGIAEKLRQDYYALYPELKSIHIEEYYILVL